MAKGWGRGGGRVSQGRPHACIMLKEQRLRSGSSWACTWAALGTALRITDCAKRMPCQALPLNSSPIISLSKHVVNTNMGKTLCRLLRRALEEVGRGREGGGGKITGNQFLLWRNRKQEKSVKRDVPCFGITVHLPKTSNFNLGGVGEGIGGWQRGGKSESNPGFSMYKLCNQSQCPAL